MSHSRVIARAVALSEIHGIDGWSVRDIASDLGVAPSVIYHYFPNKEALCDAVMDAIIAQAPIPCSDLHWKEWFTQALLGLRPLLLRYHGLTQRMIYGRFTPSAVPMLDAAIDKLHEAGFAHNTGLAYVMIMNSALTTVSMRNLRAPQQGTTRHDMTAMLERLEDLAVSSPGLRCLIDDYLGPLSQPENEEELSTHYYQLLIAAVIDGIDHILLPHAANSDPATPA